VYTRSTLSIAATVAISSTHLNRLAASIALRELRLHGQRRHLATERRHGPVLVDRAQRVQLSQRVPHELQIGFIQKVKVEDVQSFQAQGFEVQNRSHE
jgi:hypothetical protein